SPLYSRNWPYNGTYLCGYRARSYYKVNQLFLVDLFLIGFMLEVAGGGRSRPWDTDPVRNTVHPLLVETCLWLVGTRSHIAENLYCNVIVKSDPIEQEI